MLMLLVVLAYVCPVMLALQLLADLAAVQVLLQLTRLLQWLLLITVLLVRRLRAAR